MPAISTFDDQLRLMPAAFRPTTTAGSRGEECAGEPRVVQDWLKPWIDSARRAPGFGWAFFQLPEGTYVGCHEDNSAATPRLHVVQFERDEATRTGRNPLEFIQHVLRTEPIPRDASATPRSAIQNASRRGQARPRIRPAEMRRILALLDTVLLAAPVAVLLPPDAGPMFSVVSTLLDLVPGAAQWELSWSGWNSAGEADHPTLRICADERDWTHVSAMTSRIDLTDPGADFPDLQSDWARLLVSVHASEGWGGITRLVSSSPPDIRLQDLRVLSGTPWEAEARQWQDHSSRRKTTFAGSGFGNAPPTSSLLAGHPARQGLLDLNREELLERLDAFDEAALAAIAGGPDTLTQLESLWPELQAELSGDLLEESRRHFLLRTIDQWQASIERDGTLDADAARYGIGVLRLLLTDNPEGEAAREGEVPGDDC